MKHRYTHHRIFATKRRVFNQNAKARRAQTFDARGDTREAVNYGLRHVGQTNPVANNTKFNVTFKYFRERLRARFFHCVARGHAVADIDIADHIHRKKRSRAVAKTCVGNCANAARRVARIQIDQLIGANGFYQDCKKPVISGIQDFLRPIFTLAFACYRKPLLVWIMHKGIIGNCLA